MAGKQPAFQFYPGDWLKDPELRICSFEAKGVWMDALCLAFACSERGVFSSNGRPWSRDQLAAAVGCRVEVIDELIENGVARIREEDDAIYCARMVKDEKTRLERVNAGSKGGSKTQANGKQTPKQNSSKPQAKGQAKSGSSSSSSTSVVKEDPYGSSCPETDVSEPYPGLPAFPCDGPVGEWLVPSDKVSQWQETYPSLDVVSEIRRALQWIRDNPSKRKTASGMARFIGNWLSKAQNSNRKPPPGQQKRSRVATAEQLANWNPLDGGISE